MSDPTALFVYGVNLGDGSDYFLTRRDVFEDFDELDEDIATDGMAEYLFDRLTTVTFTDPEPDIDNDYDNWLIWSKSKATARDALPVTVVQHGASEGDEHLILAAKPTYRTDWNGPIPVPHVGSLAPLHKAVTAAMATLGVESKERPGWLLAAYQ